MGGTDLHPLFTSKGWASDMLRDEAICELLRLANDLKLNLSNQGK